MDNRGTLSPGDLCVIIADRQVPPWARIFVGLTVVLISVYEDVERADVRFAPFWRVTGLPQGAIVSHEILRKIPPDRMLDARSHMEPVADKVVENPSKVTL